MSALIALDQLESALAALPQVPCGVIHAFGPGIYIRQVILPSGALVLGHRHRAEHLNILLKGRLTLFNANGTRDELTAPVVCTGTPGRKVALIHEEVTWLNLWATLSTDAQALEEQLLDKADGLEIVASDGSLAHAEDRADFAHFVQSEGLSLSSVREDSQWQADQIPFPRGVYKCMIAPSMIEGEGLHACADIAPGELIAPALIDEKRTPAGRYTNHAKRPNALMQWQGDRVVNLIALRPIRGSLGGRPGEEITVDYRQVMTLGEIRFPR